MTNLRNQGMTKKRVLANLINVTKVQIIFFFFLVFSF